jgi:hypothetical protein
VLEWGRWGVSGTELDPAARRAVLAWAAACDRGAPSCTAVLKNRSTPIDLAADAAAEKFDPLLALPPEAWTRFPAAALFQSMAPVVRRVFGVAVASPDARFHVAGCMVPRQHGAVQRPTWTTRNRTFEEGDAESDGDVPAPPPRGSRAVRMFVCVRAGARSSNYLSFQGARSLPSMDNPPRTRVS